MKYYHILKNSNVKKFIVKLFKECKNYINPNIKESMLGSVSHQHSMPSSNNSKLLKKKKYKTRIRLLAIQQL